MELRTGSPKGELLAQIPVTPTGSWDKWVELSSPIPKITKRTDLFVVFLNPGKGGLMNLDWVQFNP